MAALGLEQGLELPACHGPGEDSPPTRSSPSRPAYSLEHSSRLPSSITQLSSSRYFYSQASPGPALCPHSILPCRSPHRVGSRRAPSASTRWFFPRACHLEASSGGSLRHTSRQMSHLPWPQVVCALRFP